MAKQIALKMKQRNPGLTAEQIAEGIAGLQASTAAERLRWAMEERERERETQKTASPMSIDARPARLEALQ